jgi:hypothetical protein
MLGCRQRPLRTTHYHKLVHFFNRKQESTVANLSDAETSFQAHRRDVEGRGAARSTVRLKSHVAGLSATMLLTYWILHLTHVFHFGC